MRWLRIVTVNELTESLYSLLHRRGRFLSSQWNAVNKNEHLRMSAIDRTSCSEEGENTRKLGQPGS